MIRALYAVGLSLIWVMAWGSPSPANVLGGLAVAALLLTVTPNVVPTHGAVRVRPVAIARLAAYLLVKVVESNVLLIRQIVARQPRLRSGVIAVPLPEGSDGLVTLIANTMALTPGTIPLEVQRDLETVIYVHILQLHDPEESRREIRHLAALAYRAFGSDEAAAAATAMEQEVAS